MRQPFTDQKHNLLGKILSFFPFNRAENEVLQGAKQPQSGGGGPSEAEGKKEPNWLKPDPLSEDWIIISYLPASPTPPPQAVRVWDQRNRSQLLTEAQENSSIQLSASLLLNQQNPRFMVGN